MTFEIFSRFTFHLDVVVEINFN